MKPQRRFSPPNHRKSPAFKLASWALSLMLCVVAAALSAASSYAQGREYKVKTFKDMPVAVEEVRNLQKEKDWFDDLEIVVRNISDKPIYFIAGDVEFPNIPPPANAPKGARIAYPLQYGRNELGDVSELASPEDVPIKPGETHSFTIAKGFGIGLENMKKRMNLPPEATKKIIIEFQVISFGDGTGFEGGGGKSDYRRKTSLDKNRDGQSSPREDQSYLG
jgi:hypothetical protein